MAKSVPKQIVFSVRLHAISYYSRPKTYASDWLHISRCKGKRRVLSHRRRAGVWGKHMRIATSMLRALFLLSRLPEYLPDAWTILILCMWSSTRFCREIHHEECQNYIDQCLSYEQDAYQTELNQVLSKIIGIFLLNDAQNCSKWWYFAPLSNEKADFLLIGHICLETDTKKSCLCWNG